MSQCIARQGRNKRSSGGCKCCESRIQKESYLDYIRNKTIQGQAIPEEARIFDVLRKYIYNCEHDFRCSDFEIISGIGKASKRYVF
ncbi:hypothetical protein AR158_c598R [Paramecium bursaria Chlorella virus AR158]|uniref:hypothetical protein n=1 Tax=Paramecium bursaria Chlorella virus AR158 TaxID=380598 RepID=UPI00015AA7BF|nr:hypothetical protein AR158_c598R [Paramecium bursaria Chlorella virus AR158]ABU44143.1 hypothetical protein AR158_c598R [Paramecium bursaria Chlorella virus AR158]